MATTLIKDLFESDVTRDIAPVVYFHEQSPEKLADEVGEYIVTGGFPENHPNHQRVPDGIHEQYVHLLRVIVEELGPKRRRGPPRVLDFGLLRLGQVELREAAGVGARRCGAPRWTVAL